MSTPQDDAPDRVSTPTVSTAPTSGTTSPPDPPRWQWGALPSHLGRARTSTVILSVLFLAVFALYLNVRPDAPATRTSPAGGGSDIEVPLVPLPPTEPTTPEPTQEPVPTTGPAEPGEETDGPPTTTPSTSTPPGPTTPTTAPSGPTRTSEPAVPTGGPTEDEPSTPSSPAAP